MKRILFTVWPNTPESLQWEPGVLESLRTSPAFAKYFWAAWCQFPHFDDKFAPSNERTSNIRYNMPIQSIVARELWPKYGDAVAKWSTEEFDSDYYSRYLSNCKSWHDQPFGCDAEAYGESPIRRFRQTPPTTDEMRRMQDAVYIAVEHTGLHVNYLIPTQGAVNHYLHDLQGLRGATGFAVSNRTYFMRSAEPIAGEALQTPVHWWGTYVRPSAYTTFKKVDPRALTPREALQWTDERTRTWHPECLGQLFYCRSETIPALLSELEALGDTGITA